MPYIPKEHAKYNLLPFCRKDGGEVFSYSSEIVEAIHGLLPEGESVIPYGFDSSASFDAQIDEYIARFGRNKDILNELGELLIAYKADIKQRNIKENWSVVKYIGESTGGSGLTHSRYYYWPCSIEEQEYEGVIDDEEFTSYLYPTGSHLWEIIEDPTGMANRTIYRG